MRDGLQYRSTLTRRYGSLPRLTREMRIFVVTMLAVGTSLLGNLPTHTADAAENQAVVDQALHVIAVVKTGHDGHVTAACECVGSVEKLGLCHGRWDLELRVQDGGLQVGRLTARVQRPVQIVAGDAEDADAGAVIDQPVTTGIPPGLLGIGGCNAAHDKAVPTLSRLMCV